MSAPRARAARLGRPGGQAEQSRSSRCWSPRLWGRRPTAGFAALWRHSRSLVIRPDPAGLGGVSARLSHPCRAKLDLPETAGTVPATGHDTPGTALRWLSALRLEAAGMDNMCAPAQSRADDIAAGLPHQGRSGPVMTAAGQPRTPGTMRRSRAGQDLAA
jgi:hypothetical protein